MTINVLQQHTARVSKFSLGYHTLTRALCIKTCITRFSCRILTVSIWYGRFASRALKTREREDEMIRILIAVLALPAVLLGAHVYAGEFVNPLYQYTDDDKSLMQTCLKGTLKESPSL